VVEEYLKLGFIKALIIKQLYRNVMGRIHSAFGVLVPVLELSFIPGGYAFFHTMFCFALIKINPCDPDTRCAWYSQLLWIKYSTVLDFTGEWTHKNVVNPKLKIFFGDHDETGVLPVSEVLQVKRTISIVRIVGVKLHYMSAISPIHRIFIKKEKVLT
jgi:hypothetical protein